MDLDNFMCGCDGMPHHWDLGRWFCWHLTHFCILAGMRVTWLCLCYLHTHTFWLVSVSLPVPLYSEPFTAVAPLLPTYPTTACLLPTTPFISLPPSPLTMHFTYYPSLPAMPLPTCALCTHVFAFCTAFTCTHLCPHTHRTRF